MAQFDFSNNKRFRLLTVIWHHPTITLPECIPDYFHLLPALFFWRRANWRGEKGGFGICFAFLGFMIRYVSLNQ